MTDGTPITLESIEDHTSDGHTSYKITYTYYKDRIKSIHNEPDGIHSLREMRRGKFQGSCGHDHIGLAVRVTVLSEDAFGIPKWHDCLAIKRIDVDIDLCALKSADA